MNTEEPHIPSDDFEQIAPQEQLTKVTGMYKEWFLDYASYVILERAVPAIEDGFKPVQRRIMHALKELDDGRYNKVANVVTPLTTTKIIITCGAPFIPELLVAQLKVGGKLVIPVGDKEQVMTRITRVSEKEFSKKEYGNFKFVPFLKGKNH